MVIGKLDVGDETKEPAIARLKALEQATKDGHWEVAEHLELVNNTDAGLAGDAEVTDAANTFMLRSKLKELKAPPLP